MRGRPLILKKDHACLCFRWLGQDARLACLFCHHGVTLRYMVLLGQHSPTSASGSLTVTLESDTFRLLELHQFLDPQGACFLSVRRERSPGVGGLE